MRVASVFTVVWLVATAAGCGQTGQAVPTSASAIAPSKQQPAAPFLVKPYIQWGSSPDWQDAGLQLLWHDDDVNADWAVEYRTADTEWRKAEPLFMRRVAVPSVPPHRIYQASVQGLKPGCEWTYRVRKEGEPVFSATGHAPPAADRPQRFVVFGDCGANTKEERAIAYQAYLAHPDFVLITGDIVYSRGRITEYRDKFWPIYNADEASPAQGAPLLRSTLFLAAPGNHDIGSRDLDKYPDGLAYFLDWTQPLNGPLGAEGSASVPVLKGPEANRKAFQEAAGPAYPRMANFSLDHGNAHWLILDANSYVDWTDRDLRAWVERDLAAARHATWRFVGLHQPGFQSAKAHADEQNMRVMADIFEAQKVDVVFCGHVHNYQRSYPLHFFIDRQADGKPIHQKELVPGHWTLDRSFDGVTRTRPDGVIYIVTGGGGASLYNPEQQDDPSSWHDFTAKFISKVHSLTVAEIDGPTLRVRQLSLDGTELDRFLIHK